jgi:hypothetical protein
MVFVMMTARLQPLVVMRSQGEVCEAAADRGVT